MRWAGGGSSITSYFSSRCLAGRQGEISVLSTVWITVLALMLGHCVRPCLQFVGFHGGSLTRTLQTLQQYTCEGKTMLISCPASTVISVQYAKFGRSVPSSRMCPAGDTLTSPALMSEVMLAPGYRVTAAEDTNCLAIRSLEVLLELCEHQPRCQVRAESTTFRQDPCPATSKYLEVHYKCRPNDFQRQTVCEGEQMEIGCGKALRIAVYSAMFGRAPNGSVSCPSDRPGYFDCQAAETVSEVRGACQGRKRCDLLASEAVFGNPCAAGIKKYLAVTYACVPKRILKELHRHKGHLKARHNKKRGKKKAQEVEGEGIPATDGTDLEIGIPRDAHAASQSLELLEISRGTDTQEQASADAAETTDREIPQPDITQDLSQIRITSPLISSDQEQLLIISRQNRTSPVALTPADHTETDESLLVTSTAAAASADPPDMGGISDLVTHMDLPSTEGALSTSQTEVAPSVHSAVETSPESGLSVVCINVTMSTIRTAAGSSDAPMGVAKDWFSTFMFIHYHQEKAILYVVLGVCIGVISLLTIVLGQVCVQFKRKSRAKLDLTEPTHSRNVTHNHSTLETPMLERSDSIDRIEVVRFEPRGTMRSGYHSTLRSDSGDRSLSNYYG